jgi:hypothetical protein
VLTSPERSFRDIQQCNARSSERDLGSLRGSPEIVQLLISWVEAGDERRIGANDDAPRRCTRAVDGECGTVGGLERVRGDDGVGGMA